MFGSRAFFSVVTPRSPILDALFPAIRQKLLAATLLAPDKWWYIQPATRAEFAERKRGFGTQTRRPQNILQGPQGFASICQSSPAALEDGCACTAIRRDLARRYVRP